MRRFIGFLALLAAALIVASTPATGAPATPGGAALTVKGDPQAWAEIETAMTKLHGLKSYRAKAAMPGGGTMTIDVVNPDRQYVRIDVGGGVVETVIVGNEVRYRAAAGAWTCVAQRPLTPETNPQKMTGEVTASKGPSIAIDGVQTQSYTYAWKPPQGPTAHARIYVNISNGLPRRMEILDDKSATQMTFDYFDYDTPITITLPACR